MAENRRQAALMERSTLDLLLTGVAKGQYHLVLGAGASAGISNRRGELPLANELTKVLVEDEPGIPRSLTLQRAYSHAVKRKGDDVVTELLRSYYAGCHPAAWQLEAAKLPWSAIWTFNIDDAIEQAYEDCSDRAQRADIRLWREPVTPLGGARDSVPLVHLHGYVGEVARRDDPQLVFSLEQYLSALRDADRGSWQTRFRGEYPTAPVIIIGARLHEELDFASVIQAGNFSADFGQPSFIIRPRMSEFEMDEYRGWGLTPVNSTADQFFDLLVPAMQARESAREGSAYESRYTRTTFYSLTTRRKDESRPSDSDFYGGSEPHWLDILESLDATPNWVKTLSGEMGSPTTYPNKQLLYFIHGSPFSGKSTALLRLVRELMRSGWRAEMLGGAERLDVDETLFYFRDRPESVLVVDDLRADAVDISELLARADGAGQRMVVLATDRSKRRIHVRRVIPQKYIVGIHDRLFVEPTPGLWGAILGKRARAGRLGRLEVKSRREQQLHFTEHGNDLFSALASLEDATGFIGRGVDVLDGLQPATQTAFAVVGLFASVGLDTPVFAAASASGLRVDQLLDVCKTGGELDEWVSLEGNQTGFLKLRHRYLGELLVGHLASPGSAFPLADVARSALIAIADRVSRQSISRRDFFHRAASQLMDIAFVQQIVGSNDVDGWYALLRDHYGWNARFWEQRALGLPDDLDKAYSYAERAVRIHRDSFSLNTLGTVLMRRAAHPETKESGRRSYWVDACDALRGSRDDGRGRFDFPFITFLGHTGRLLNLAEDDRQWMESMEAEVRSWSIAASEAGLAGEQDLKTLASRFPRQWAPEILDHPSARRTAAPRRRSRRSQDP